MDSREKQFLLDGLNTASQVFMDLAALHSPHGFHLKEVEDAAKRAAEIGGQLAYVEQTMGLLIRMSAVIASIRSTQGADGGYTNLSVN